MRILIALFLTCLCATAQTVSYRNFNVNQFGSNSYRVSIKGGVLLTNPVVSSGSISGLSGLTNAQGQPLAGTGLTNSFIANMNGLGTNTTLYGPTFAGASTNLAGAYIYGDQIISGSATPTNGVFVPQRTLSFGGTGATNVSLSLSTNYGGTFFLTLTTNAYFTQPFGLFAGNPFCVHLVQDATGARTVGFDTNYWRFPSGQILTTTTNANSKSVLSCLVSPYATNVFVVQTLNFQ